jgi:hypothetical protein
MAGFLCSLASALPAAAGAFSWDYHRTGFRSSNPNFPQTAVSMRNNQTWPIVYGIDQGDLNAYSLFPVPYSGQIPVSGQPTNWHPIGDDLTGDISLVSEVFLQAASGRSDGFGVAAQSPQVGSPPEVTVYGTYSGGFQGHTAGGHALKFGENDSPFVATSTTLPNLPSDQKIFDVALSSIGDVAAVSQRSNGNGPLTYWQKSPLLGGNWHSVDIGPPFSQDTLYGATVDLAFDAAARPHIIGVSSFFSSDSPVVAHRFDIISGTWKSSILDTGHNNGPRIVDVAAASNDQGIVGAAWVNNGVLKYAFMDTAQTFPQWIVTNVTSVTPTGQPLEPSQGVGLAYDNAGLPVLSFVERFDRQIWVAYDPPALIGDFTQDRVVDGADLTKWQSEFGTGEDADADSDGDSDGADFLAWQLNLTPAPSTPTSANAAVPEPASIVTLLVAASCVLTAARRQSLSISPPQSF